MLSAFIARPIVELKQRDKSKIESILAYGDRLLVGLHSGSLRIYRINEQSDEQAETNEQNGANDDGQQISRQTVRPADLLREEERFSRKPIQQLAIIKEANMLVSLSDNHVSIHDLHSYTLQERLERTKGATSFAVTSNIVKDPATGIPSIVSRLAVAVKRRIVLWSWQDMELSGETKEIALIASVKVLTWATGHKLVAGMDPGFVMVNVESQEITDINRPGVIGDPSGQSGVRFGAVNTSGMGYMGMGSWVPKPMATRLSEGQLLLARDVNTLFIDSDGKPLEKRQIPWALAPEAIGYSYPYMLTLQPPSKGALDVRNPDTLSLLQSIPLPNATFLHVPQPNISLAHAGKGFLVASDRCVWRMGALNYEDQIEQLISKARYDEAISLLNMLEDTLLKDKEGQLREVKMLKAQGLFDQRHYREAMDLFSEASAPPERVIALYPRSIAGDVSSIVEVRDGGSEADEQEINGTTSNPSHEMVDHPSTPASTLGRSVLGKFKTQHKRTDSDVASERSMRIDSKSDVDAAKDRSTDASADKPLEGKDLALAVNELRGFLAESRKQFSRFLNYEGTFKQPLPPPGDPQRESAISAFRHLISLPSDPGSVDWEAKLRDAAVMVDTVLFRAYVLVSPTLVGPLCRLPNFCDPEVVQEKLYESGRYSDLIDFLHGKKLHRQALEMLEKFGKNEADKGVSPALRGPQKTVAYLQQLPPELIDLILEFSEWPLRTDPDACMEVFLADTENAETLPRDRVLDFLQKIDLKLAVKYLEHIFNGLNDLTPDFHQSLAELYLERLKAHDFGSEEERTQWRERLQDFLRSSKQYNKGKIFRQLPVDDPDFYEARAIVLSQMGQHKQALQIYVFQLQDHQKAEDYCNQTYLSALSDQQSPHPALFPTSDPEDAQPSIYHTLLSLYLSPPHPYTPNLPPALTLLSKHGARLPASSTLDLIPSSLPVAQLESYFRGRIRSANSVLNEERIVRGLRGVEKVRVEAALALGADGKGGRSRRVVVGEDRHCVVCHKRFGGSAIRVYPDGGVVHYGCFGRGRAATGEGRDGGGDGGGDRMELSGRI